MDVISLGRVRRSIHAGFNQLFTVITNDDNEILFEINNRGGLAKNARRPIPSLSKSRIETSSLPSSSLQQPPSSTIKKLLTTSKATNMSASHVASLSQRARPSNHHNHTNSNNHHNHHTSTSVSRLVEFPPPSSSSQHGPSSAFEIAYESSSSASSSSSSSSGSSSSVWDAFSHMYSSFKRALLNFIDNTKVFEFFSKLKVFLNVFITTLTEKFDDS